MIIEKSLGKIDVEKIISDLDRFFNENKEKLEEGKVNFCKEKSRQFIAD